jgi:iron complex transport system ATP-binding protein
MVNKNAYLVCDMLSIGYEKPLLQPFQFAANKGQFIALIGSNGVGKSTFLRTLANLQQPLNGFIQLNNQYLSNLTALQLAQLLTIVTTSKIHGFNLTCKDVIASGRAPYTNWLHQLTAKDEAIINDAIERCYLNPYQTKLIEMLSDGLYQKTMIAKALTQQTDIILLDEPSAFLDYSSKHDLFAMLKQLCEIDNKLVIISSHDLEFVKNYCTHICIMDELSGMQLASNEAMQQTDLFQNMMKGRN